MISVLIPIYNYNIVGLVKDVHEQLLSSSVDFEILCLEDGSDEHFIELNLPITSLSHIKHLISETNEGRLKARKRLSEEAKHKWLLYLDADVKPKHKFFIKNYIEALKSNHDAYFGGFAYYETPPNEKFLLRWKYGKKHEQVTEAIRKLTPYKVIISANFLIKKSVFLALNLVVNKKLYGYDNYFASQLKSQNVSVKHLDNEVYHLGIETSEQYLQKKEQAAEALLFFYETGLITSHENGLLKLFLVLRKWHLNHFFSFIYLIFKNSLKRQLTGKNPSLKLLQLYRLSYLCNFNNNKQNIIS